MGEYVFTISNPTNGSVYGVFLTHPEVMEFVDKYLKNQQPLLFSRLKHGVEAAWENIMERNMELAKEEENNG